MIDSVARFLETRGMLEDALNVAEGLEKLSASAWENGKTMWLSYRYSCLGRWKSLLNYS